MSRVDNSVFGELVSIPAFEIKMNDYYMISNEMLLQSKPYIIDSLTPSKNLMDITWEKNGVFRIITIVIAVLNVGDLLQNLKIIPILIRSLMHKFKERKLTNNRIASTQIDSSNSAIQKNQRTIIYFTFIPLFICTIVRILSKN